MKVLVAGDLLPLNRVAELFNQRKYETVFGRIREYIKEADYSIVNFECPICTGSERPISKCGPNLRCNDTAIGALYYASFSCVTLANNHFRDFGDDGCRNTLKVLDENRIDHVGAGNNAEEASIVLYKVVDGVRLAIINCCEHEFSIATEKTAGSNSLNIVKQFYAIQEARKCSDYVLVIVHGGHEHYQLPSPRMQETYRFFVNVGADAVVNHHQHCYSGYEMYKGKPILYGLGNFCFDNPIKRADKWNEGYMVLFDFNETEHVMKLIPYNQCDETPDVIPLTASKEDSFFNEIAKLNSIISNEEELTEHFRIWCDSKLGQKRNLFSPYYGSFLEKLHNKGLIPTLKSPNRMKDLTDHIECESHRDTTLYYLHAII